MNWILRFGLMTMLAAGLIFVAGCDKETDTTGTGSDLLMGDTTDMAFQEINDLFDDVDMHDAFTISADLSFELIEAQFPNSAVSGNNGRERLSSTLGDSSVIVIANYTYTNGWHVFGFTAALYEWNMDQLQLTATLAGTDSIRVLAGGVAQQVPDTTANAYDIRAHFEWDFVEGTDTFTAHHSLSLVADFEKEVPDMTVNADISQSHSGSLVFNPETDSAATCALSLSYDETVTNVVYLFGLDGEPGGCPVSGSVAATATIDLTCTGALSGEELAINGTWYTTATVLDGGDIRVTYSDGTTSWTATETCVEEDAQALPGLGW